MNINNALPSVTHGLIARAVMPKQGQSDPVQTTAATPHPNLGPSIEAGVDPTTQGRIPPPGGRNRSPAEKMYCVLLVAPLKEPLVDAKEFLTKVREVVSHQLRFPAPFRKSSIAKIINNVLKTPNEFLSADDKSLIIKSLGDALVGVYGYVGKHDVLTIKIGKSNHDLPLRLLPDLADRLTQNPNAQLADLVNECLADGASESNQRGSVANTLVEPEANAPPVQIYDPDPLSALARSTERRFNSPYDMELGAALLNQHLTKEFPFAFNHHWMNYRVFKQYAPRLVMANQTSPIKQCFSYINENFKSAAHWFSNPRAVRYMLDFDEGAQKAVDEDGLFLLISRTTQEAEAQCIERSKRTESSFPGNAILNRMADRIGGKADGVGSTQVGSTTLSDGDVNALWSELERHNVLFQWHQQSDKQVQAAPIHNRLDNVRAPDATALHDCVQTGFKLHANSVFYENHLHVVAAQKPVLDAIPGFWEAVVGHKIPLIVDLTTPSDNQGEPHYGPEDVDETFLLRAPDGKVVNEVTLVERTNLPGLGHLETLRIDRDSTVVKRLHITDWPEQGAVTPEKLEAVGDKVRQLMGWWTQSVLIHGRIGMGRTGTLATYLSIRRDLDFKYEPGNMPSVHELLLNATNHLLHGRLSRGPLFIETPQQLKLALEASVQALKRKQAEPIEPIELVPTQPVPRPVDTAPSPMQVDDNQGKTQDVSFLTNPPDIPLQQAQAQTQAQTQARDVIADIARLDRTSLVRANSTGSISVDLNANADSAELWTRYEQASAEPPPDFNTAVPVNDSGVQCINHNVVQVETMPGQLTPIHANKIEVPSAANPRQVAGSYIAGQSPQQLDAAQNFLIHGITSGQGLFQFVAPKTHAAREPSREQTVVGYITQLLQNVQPGQPQPILGGRYELQSLEVQTTDDDHKRYLLTYRDTQNPQAEPRVIPITQLGMNMTNGVMDAQAVQRANAVMNDHKAVLQTLNREVTTGPTIVSFGGVGRTSVLITYSDVMRQIQSGEVNDSAALDAALERVIMAGRLSRGRHFIHSQAQFDIVRQTLLTELQRKNAPRPSPRANEAGGRMEADTVTL